MRSWTDKFDIGFVGGSSADRNSDDKKAEKLQ
jgi:hypothetical protein